MSNFDFVNFSPITKTPADGVMERRNCLLSLLLYNVMICLLGWGVSNSRILLTLEAYMYVTIIAEGLLILTYGHRVMRVL